MMLDTESKMPFSATFWLFQTLQMLQLVPEGSRQEATSPLHPVGQLLPVRTQLILPGVAGGRSEAQHCPQLQHVGVAEETGQG